MASLKEIAREYRDEIMDGIAWVAIWKTGRSWNAKAFWLNLETERIEDEEMEEAREIVAADPKAIFINEYYTAHMGEGKLDEIVEGIRFMYENEYNLLANNTAYAEEEQVIDCGKGRYRYLTELECWRLQGYTDEDFERAKKAQQKKGRYYTALYKQAGNSIAVPIFESIFRKIILNEVREKEEQK